MNIDVSMIDWKNIEETDTVLTEQEFCSRLMKIREHLNG